MRIAFAKSPLARRYQFSVHIKPFYLHGEFDGDGRQDTAILIKDRSTGKIGIAIYHGKANRLVLVGAGRDWDNGNDDFPGLNAWYVFQRAPVGKAPMARSRRNCVATRSWSSRLKRRAH